MTLQILRLFSWWEGGGFVLFFNNLVNVITTNFGETHKITLPLACDHRVHKQITNRQEHQSHTGTVVLQMTYTCSHILRNNTNSTNANQRGGTVTAQNTAEDPLKMVLKKDRNM
jgi:hypothetical protein